MNERRSLSIECQIFEALEREAGEKTKRFYLEEFRGCLPEKGFKLSLTADIILSAVNLRYTITDLIIKAVNFLISS